MYYKKSMRTANKKRTVCEVMREMYDILILEEEKNESIFPLLKEAHNMCKRMSHKLYEYNKDFDKEWWEDNKDYEEDLKRRMEYKNE